MSEPAAPRPRVGRGAAQPLLRRRRPVALLLALAIAGCAAPTERADPASDAPEAARRSGVPFVQAPTYAQTLALWRDAADINAWIGARFEYDRARALALSETQRQRGARLPIHEPATFFAAPRGVCVDLARFAVETLRSVDPAADVRYLMIEFDPVSVEGQTLRRHWVALVRQQGAHYVFADSKRPGHMAGPYASTREFVDAYAAYRGRTIVAFRELPGFERQRRRAAVRQPGGERR